MKKFGQSIYDSLIRLMPELKQNLINHRDYVDPIAAKALYSLWRNGSQKTGSKVYKKPATLSQEEIKRMKSAGLVQSIGENISITDKGSKVINIMILGDSRSIFEDDGLMIDYDKALASTKNLKTAKIKKTASVSWWDRFEKIAAKYQCSCGEEFEEAPTKRIGDEIHYQCPVCGSSQITPNPYHE